MLSLYDSRTGEVKEVTPVNNVFGIYTCGPTLYKRPHIGNYRTFVVADTMNRVINYLSDKEVTHVINGTDVGHLSSDERSEDKLSKQLRAQQKPVTLENMLQLAQEVATEFKEDLATLNVTPDFMPMASDHVQEMIAIIEDANKHNAIYESADTVYLDTSKVHNYQQFSDSGSGSGDSQQNPEKKSDRDFALWKKNNELGWDSPWGKGFPGWHIECTAMSRKLLGEKFSIHTGGQDLSAIHHTNEIAQSLAAGYEQPAHIWTHIKHVVLAGNAKMAKSLGTSILVPDLARDGWHPMSIRLWLLSTHYRHELTYTTDAIAAMQEKLQQLVLHLLDQYPTVSALNELAEASISVPPEIIDVISNDLRTDQVLTKLMALPPANIDQVAATLQALFGINLITLALETVDNLPVTEIEKRKSARDAGEYATADAIRNDLVNAGYIVRDEASVSVVTSLSKLAKLY